MFLMAELACESHSTEHVAKVFGYCLKLMRMTGTIEKRKMLEKVMRACVYESDTVINSDEGIYVNGTIDVNELAKYAVWVDIEEDKS